MISFQAKISKDTKDGGYNVVFPDLPGCITQGETIDEALEYAKEALSLYLEEAVDPKWQVPMPKTRKGRSYHWVCPAYNVGAAILIRRTRMMKGFTQVQLAKSLGITKQQLQKLETPGKSNPTVKMLERISEALGVDMRLDVAA